MTPHEERAHAVRPMTRGKLIALFGCGGDRDPFKRPRMARVAEELAGPGRDYLRQPANREARCHYRADPRRLSPQGRSKARVEPNRRAAIRLAISLAASGDVVVLAGKGHEDYQIIGKQKFHFDDVEEAAAAMREAREMKPMSLEEVRNAVAGICDAGKAPQHMACLAAWSRRSQRTRDT